MGFLLSGGVFGFVAHRRDLLKIDLLPRKTMRVCNAAILTPIKSGFLFGRWRSRLEILPHFCLDFLPCNRNGLLDSGSGAMFHPCDLVEIKIIVVVLHKSKPLYL